MKRLCLALIGVVALAGTATAADLARPEPAPYYPKAAVFAPPPFSWTGFYVGVNGGGGFGTSSWDTTGSRNISGGVIGGTVGYNYQFGPWVSGLEGDIDWADINGSTNNACPPGCKTSDSWLATARGRFGYAADRFLPFVTAGAAFGDIRASAPGLVSSSATKTGWTVGGGLEAALTNNWTAKVEYLYVDLGSFNCGLVCSGGALATDKVSFNANLLRAGVNYKF
jgi:outer membrane immunogenic protein